MNALASNVHTKIGALILSNHNNTRIHCNQNRISCDHRIMGFQLANQSTLLDRFDGCAQFCDTLCRIDIWY